MKKKDDEGQKRAWFLETKLDEMKERHETEVKEEQAEWKRMEQDVAQKAKEKIKDYAGRIEHEGGNIDQHRREKTAGHVRGRPHPTRKRDRKGRLEES